jgi:hypothetical protein
MVSASSAPGAGTAQVQVPRVIDQDEFCLKSVVAMLGVLAWFRVAAE